MERILNLVNKTAVMLIKVQESVIIILKNNQVIKINKLTKV
jgi:hypothetical protein